jgi:DNA-binding transcriptional ArsR family regulator
VTAILNGYALQWERLLELASRHGMLHFLNSALEAAANPVVPTEVRSRLRSLCAAAIRRNLALTGELLRILDALTAQGVTAMPYKGPFLSLHAYGDVSKRSFCDLDLIIRPSEMERAARVLLDAGYTHSRDGGEQGRRFFAASEHTCGFRCRERRTAVDVHGKVLPRYLHVAVEEMLWREVTIVKYHGRKIAQPSPETTVLLLALHGTKHAWQRFEWLSALGHFLSRTSLAWPQLMASAARLRVARIVKLSLFLVRELMETPLPPEMHEALDADKAVRRLATRLYQDLLGHPSEEHATMSGFLNYVRSLESSTDKLKCLASALIMPSEGDRACFQLPHRLRHLYPLLRPLRLTAKCIRACCFRPSLHPPLNSPRLPIW